MTICFCFEAIYMTKNARRESFQDESLPENRRMSFVRLLAVMGLP